MEDSVANTPVEVKKASPAVASVPDVWHSFRSEMDRLFDRFFSPYGMPSLRRVFDLDPGWRSDTSFSFAAPAIDLGEDDRAYKITAELRGLEAKDLDVSIAGDTLLIKGEKRQEQELSRHPARLWLVSARLCPARWGRSGQDHCRSLEGGAYADAAEDGRGPETGPENRRQGLWLKRASHPRRRAMPAVSFV